LMEIQLIFYHFVFYWLS